MAHDYKNAKRPATPARGGAAPARGAILPFLAGLSLGLLVAFAVFLYHYQSMLQGEVPQFTVHNQAGRGANEKGGTVVPTPAPSEPAPPTYDFYRILPEQEVSMSEWEAEDPAPGGTTTSERDDLLVLQVGSFKTAEAADQLKAELALLGIEADVQRVVINGQDAVHRVRIGPFKDQQAFAGTRQRLMANDVDFVVLNLKAAEAAAAPD